VLNWIRILPAAGMSMTSSFWFQSTGGWEIDVTEAIGKCWASVYVSTVYGNVRQISLRAVRRAHTYSATPRSSFSEEQQSWLAIFSGAVYSAVALPLLHPPMATQISPLPTLPLCSPWELPPPLASTLTAFDSAADACAWSTCAHLFLARGSYGL